MTEELNFRFYLIVINFNSHLWLAATLLHSAVTEARRLLNQFSREYCLELKHS